MLNIAKKDGKIINRRLIAAVNEIRNKSNQAQTLVRDLSYSFIMPLKENAGNPDEAQTILNLELGYMDTKADMVTELLQGIDAQIERLIEALGDATIPAPAATKEERDYERQVESETRRTDELLKSLSVFNIARNLKDSPDCITIHKGIVKWETPTVDYEIDVNKESWEALEITEKDENGKPRFVSMTSEKPIIEGFREHIDHQLGRVPMSEGEKDVRQKGGNRDK